MGKASTLHLGYEVGTGLPVSIPIAHLAVTGQTQNAGKTTALEALVTRSGLRAIAFITKRGEKSFDSGRQIAPFFQERADWEFVESILEATMKKRMRFERAWIVRSCAGANSLSDVQRNVAKLEAKAKGGMNQDMYMLLGEYLLKVVPMVARLPKINRVDLAPGLNVMNLLEYPEELQMLVIGSTIRWIFEHESDVVTLIPEAWKFVPQGRNTPVKLVVEKLAREGAGLKNFIWIDSQDIAGVEKLVLRAAAVWLIGVQRETNEVERALRNIHAGIKKPKPDDVATLGVGEFYACWHGNVHRTYVQPAWASENQAREIAMGLLAKDKLERPKREKDKMDYKALYEEQKRVNDELQTKMNLLLSDIPKMLQPVELQRAQIVNVDRQNKTITVEPAPKKEYTLEESLDNEQVYQAFKKRLIEEAPGTLVSLTKTVHEIEVTVKREKIQMGTHNTVGRVATLVADGFFDARRGNKDVLGELGLRGFPESAPNVSRAFGELVRLGFLRQESNGQYKAIDGMKVNIVEA